MTLQYEWIQSEFFYALSLHGFMHFYCIVAQDILEKDVPAHNKEYNLYYRKYVMKGNVFVPSIWRYNL